jgi:23S rRNA (uracil1939-C5)-methyltransferase
MDVHEVEMTGAAYGGSFVGRIEGKVVFVPFTATGEVARVEVTEEKKSFSNGVVVEVLKESGARVAPKCKVFGACGGCSYQHIEYSEQVRIKESIFLDSLKRIGGIVPERKEPAVEATEPYGYRSRARVHVDGNRWGFFRVNSNSVVDIESCPLLDPLLDTLFKSIKRAAMETPIPGLYEFEMGCSREENTTVARFYLDGKSDFDFEALLSNIEGLKGIEVWLKSGAEPASAPARAISAYGDTLSSYTVMGVSHLAPLGVFTQANTVENERLVDMVSRYATEGYEGQGPLVIDLHCGAGNLTLALASAFEHSIGIEASSTAVVAAVNNAEENGITGVEFVCADSARWLTTAAAGLEGLREAVVVLDPPRGGDRASARAVAELSPRRILYVSCSPPTLARDLQAIAAKGYTCTRAVLIDMFPQTYHMESIVVMERQD